MAKINFCYEIAEDAGVGVTSEGEFTVAYTKVSLDAKEPLYDEAFKKMHEVNIKQMLSKQTGIDLEHLKPISYEEYLEKADDDEEFIED